MLHQTGSARTLGLVRIGVFALWFWQVLSWDPAWYAELPRALFGWPSVLRRVMPEAWTAWLLDGAALAGLRALLLVGLGWSLLGLRPYRPIALATCALLTIQEQILAGFTYIDPARILPLYAAYALAAFRCSADGMSVASPAAGGRGARYGTPLLVVAVAFSFCYAFVGARRLAGTGGAVFFTDSLSHWMVVWSRQLPGPGLGVGDAVAQRPWLGAFANVAFAAVTLCEVLSPLCLVSRRFRRLWLAVIALFQLMASATMHIFFWQNFLLMFVFMTDINRLTRRVAVWRRRRARSRGPALARHRTADRRACDIRR